VCDSVGGSAGLRAAVRGAGRRAAVRGAYRLEPWSGGAGAGAAGGATWCQCAMPWCGGSERSRGIDSRIRLVRFRCGLGAAGLGLGA
jgi:hypothetical protein